MTSRILINHYYFLWLYNKSAQYKHYYNIGAGLFIWLFLLATQPFGLYNNNLGNVFYLALFLLPFGASWIVVSYSLDFLFKRVYQTVQEEKVTHSIILWMLKIVLLIHIIYLIRQLLCEWNCFDWKEYLELWFAVYLLVALVYIPFSLYAKFKYFQSIVVYGPSGSQLFEFKGEGKRTERINLEDVLYIMADDNYVDIVHQSGGIVKKLVLRATISSMENQLKSQSQFIRVHRKYIVNLKHAKEIGQDSVLISIGNSTEEIPVSKKYEERLDSITA